MISSSSVTMEAVTSVPYGQTARKPASSFGNTNGWAPEVAENLRDYFEKCLTSDGDDWYSEY